MNTYVETDSFDKIIEIINDEISENKKHLNFTSYFELPKSSLVINNSESENIAKKWMSFQRPDDLVFNHGEYITEDGFEHIINEIKAKPGSNRAIYSLLNHNDICNKGDHPIPSFLLFQVTVKDNILYATSYFRALEVGNFLKINIQEIKFNLIKIIKDCSLDPSKIRVTIHAFNAYKNIEQKIPQRFKIDRINDAVLFQNVCLKDNHAELVRLIIEKQGSDTYISTHWVQKILDTLNYNKKMIEESKLKDNIPSLKLKFESLLSTYNDLIALRKRVSHSTEIDDLNQQANDLITDISGMI